MLTIGTRGSRLALTQANLIRDRILELSPGSEVTLRIIRTSADRDTTTSIRSGSTTGVFVKEIEEALLAGEIDLAVHSMKDLPTRIPDALEISAIPEREDARDALVARGKVSDLDDLAAGALVGTGSVRRQSQILALRRDLRPKDIRGNVETRLRKLEAGDYDALILACAGLNRLGLNDRISMPLDYSRMLPAPGQGALAVETRRDDRRTSSVVMRLNHPPTAAAVFAERAFLRRMGGGCNTPIGVHARPEDGSIRIEGVVAAPDGSTLIRDSVRPPARDATPAAVALAEKLLSMGGAEILESLA